MKIEADTPYDRNLLDIIKRIEPRASVDDSIPLILEMYLINRRANELTKKEFTKVSEHFLNRSISKV